MCWPFCRSTHTHTTIIIIIIISSCNCLSFIYTNTLIIQPYLWKIVWYNRGRFFWFFGMWLNQNIISGNVEHRKPKTSHDSNTFFLHSYNYGVEFENRKRLVEIYGRWNFGLFERAYSRGPYSHTCVSVCMCVWMCFVRHLISMRVGQQLLGAAGQVTVISPGLPKAIVYPACST